MADEKKCSECGMSMTDEKNMCSCDKERCVHCCKCDKDCKCGCKAK